jgi:hypothetical protein
MAGDLTGMVNAERAARRLPSAQAFLATYAQTWAEHLRDTGGFAHSPPNYAAGYGFAAYSEDLVAISATSSAGAAIVQFMGSPAHRSAILSEKTDRVGAGVAYDPAHGRIIVVLHLASSTMPVAVRPNDPNPPGTPVATAAGQGSTCAAPPSSPSTAPVTSPRAATPSPDTSTVPTPSTPSGPAATPPRVPTTLVPERPGVAPSRAATTVPTVEATQPPSLPPSTATRPVPSAGAATSEPASTAPHEVLDVAEVSFEQGVEPTAPARASGRTSGVVVLLVVLGLVTAGLVVRHKRRAET